jgi:hypothetical protein
VQRHDAQQRLERCLFDLVNSAAHDGPAAAWAHVRLRRKWMVIWIRL